LHFILSIPKQGKYSIDIIRYIVVGSFYLAEIFRFSFARSVRSNSWCAGRQATITAQSTKIDLFAVSLL
jgi:hypothetical protein